MFDRPDVLSDSERACLQEKLQEKYNDHALPFDIKDDRHLVFEALHVLANGNPDRLFAILHPADTKDHHNGAHHGRTWLFLQKVAAGEVRACASWLPPFSGPTATATANA